MGVSALIAIEAITFWVIFLVSLSLSYLVCKARTIITVLLVFCEGEMR